MRVSMRLAAAAVLAAGTAGAADAAVVVNVAQVGANVVATTTGTLNLTGLTSQGAFSLSRGIISNFAYVATGATDGVTVTGYSGLTGPTAFGSSSTYVGATSGTGSSFAINGSGFGSPYVFVATDYVSGGLLAGTSVFANQTFASLGLATGSYLFSSGNDTVTVNVLATAVPEPAGWAMMIGGMGVVGFALRRRRVARTTVSFA